MASNLDQWNNEILPTDASVSETKSLWFAHPNVDLKSK